MDNVTETSLYAACQARNIPCDNHASDLYIPVTSETTALVKHFGHRAETFTNRVEGGLWYCVHFQFVPFWDKVAQRSRELEKAKEV